MKLFTAHLQLLICNLLWACAYPIYHFAMPQYIKPLPLLTATITFTALISLISLLWRKPNTQRVEKEDVVAIIGAALLIAVIRKGMLMFGLSMTSPIDGSIISTISPVVVLIISVMVGIELFSKRKSLGVLLGFSGAVGVILTGSDTTHEGSGMEGNIMIFLCAVISAIYMVWFKRLLKKYEPQTLLRWMFCIGAIALLPFGYKDLTEVDYAKFDTHAWLAVGYLVTMTTYVPNLFLTSALERVQPTVSSIYTYVQPAVAVGISVYFGIDKLELPTILFAILIFLGVGIVILAPKVEQKMG